MIDTLAKNLGFHLSKMIRLLGGRQRQQSMPLPLTPTSTYPLKKKKDNPND